MNSLIRSVSIIGVLLVCGIFIVAALTNYAGQLNLQHSRDLVVKTTDLLAALESVISTMKDCETGQRGYVITGNSIYLEPYEKCHSKIYRLIDKLEPMINGDAEEHERVRKLRQLVDLKLAELRKTIELRRQYGFEAAQKMVITNAGKASMDEIRSIVKDMENKQNLLLEQRLKRLAEDFYASRLYSIILILIGCVSVAGTLLLIGRLIAKREKEVALLNIQYDITYILADSPDTNDSINLVLATICKNLGWGLGAFWSLNSVDDALKCITLWCAPTFEASEFESLTRSTILAKGYGLPGKTFALQQPIWTEVLTEDLTARVNAATKEGINTGLCVPITFGNNKLGVIEFFSKKKQKTDKEMIRLIVALANQIAQSFERQQAERALIEREATLSAILDTAAEGIFSVSKEGIIESANDATCRIFGWDSSALLGKDVKTILPRFLAVTNGESGKGESIGNNELYGSDIETAGIRSDGSEFSAEISFSITNVKDKRITTGIVRDITEKKAIERRVSEFYSTVSHELRTPLTSIRGSLSLLDGGRAGEMSPRAQQLVKVARSESERLIRLINDILDIKKVESGKLELELQQIDVSDLIKQTAEALSDFAGQAGVKLSLQLDTSGEIYGDRDRLEQVLYNLLANAIKFSPAGGEVMVRVEKTSSGAWRISVKDHGPGIAESEMPKLFGLFQQLDPSDSRRKGGTGLGLAICKALVEKHNGSIGVESKVGYGSTFWFEIPDNYGQIKSHTVVRKPTLVYRAKSTVLIVEDDNKLADLLAMMLENQNFITIKSGSIKEAEEYIQSQGNPDAIILDLTLPDGDGLMLMDKLEQKGSTGVPIIIVSGREPAYDNYAYPLLIDWIKKPFDEKRLLSALALAIKKRANGQAKVLIVEDDQATREVIKQNLESLNVEFIEAADGVTAVHFARSKNPDLIVLDLGLPSLDGFEVIQILRQDKIQDIPLIIYTAKDLSENDKKELALGLTSHLIKSRTSEEEFLETVKTMLNGLLDPTKLPV